MKKITDKVMKNYKIVNITVICLCLYILFIYPIITIVTDRISPSLNRCVFLQLTGKPCPLCGGTRFLKNINLVFTDISYAFNIFGIIVVILILEVIIRTINLVKNNNNRKTVISDIIIHGVLIIGYVIYIIYFFMK